MTDALQPPRRTFKVRRRTILQCACERFAATGYEGVSMEAVARGAGVAKMTLYSYFGDKTGLFNAVIDHQLEQLPPPVLDEACHRDLRSRLTAIACDLVTQQLHPASTALAQMLARSNGAPHVTHLERLHERYRPYLVRLEQLLAGRCPDAALASRQFVRLVAGASDPASTLDADGATPEVLREAMAAVNLFVSAYARSNG